MLSIQDLEALRQATSAHDATALDAALRQIGSPPDEAIAASAAALMSHPDRNLRVLALRVLAHQSGERALRGVLAGLRDEKRRVLAVAIQACPNFLCHDEIVARLTAIVRDEGQKRKLRRRALSMLAGDDGRLQSDLWPSVYAALQALMTKPAYRFPILFGMARLALRPRTRALLEAFAASRDGAESRMARRALRGERIIHIDSYAADDAMRQWITAACDIAHGRMFYWLPRVRHGA